MLRPTGVGIERAPGAPIYLTETGDFAGLIVFITFPEVFQAVFFYGIMK